jgi:hypothetical protein
MHLLEHSCINELGVHTTMALLLNSSHREHLVLFLRRLFFTGIAPPQKVVVKCVVASNRASDCTMQCKSMVNVAEEWMEMIV